MAIPTPTVSPGNTNIAAPVLISRELCMGDSLPFINGNTDYFNNVTYSLQLSANAKVDKAGDTMTGTLNMGANKVTSSTAPSDGFDLTNKAYVDTSIATKIYTNTVADIQEQGVNDSSGDGASFFILGDGTLRFCGKNSHYMGGVGTLVKSVVTLPTPPAFSPPLKVGEKIIKVITQGYSTYVITNRGSLYVAGENSSYQLGYPSAVDIPIFTRTIKPSTDTADGDSVVVLNNGDTVVDVVAGSGNGYTYLTGLARTSLGKVYAWGYNGKTLQRAGLGNTTDNYITSPTVVTLGLPAYTSDPVVQITSGGNAGNMVLGARTNSGKVYLMGENSDGACGSNNTTDIHTFTEPLGLPTNYVAIELICGGEANNLSSWVILNDHSVYGTGFNNQYQVNGMNTNVTKLFSHINALDGLGITKLRIHTDSSYTSCWALGGPDKAWTTARCWGTDRIGQFGVNSVTTTPRTVTNYGWPFLNGATIKDLVIGGNDSLKVTIVIDSNDNVWAAGYNATYLCGNGRAASSQTTFQQVLYNRALGKPTKLLLRSNGVNVAGTSVPRTCAFLQFDSGKLLGWGYDSTSVGQLGVDASPDYAPIPAPVLFLS